MIQEYYIFSGKSRSGPFDMVSLVRKIRNGSLTAQTQIQLGEASESKPANEWAELAEFFGDKKDDHAHPERGMAHQHSLTKALGSGWSFLQRNQYSTVFTGVFVLIVILLAAGINLLLPASLHAIAYMACFFLGHFLLSCYMLAILRMARGQPIDPVYMQSRIAPVMKSLLLSSLLVCIPAIVGLALLTSTLPTPVLLIGLCIFAVPGLFSLAVYSYAPLLIIDKGIDFWEAMELSRKTVLKNGLENAGVIYALLVINFIAGLAALLPLILTLPVTMGAVVEMYDETLG